MNSQVRSEIAAVPAERLEVERALWAPSDAVGARVITGILRADHDPDR